MNNDLLECSICLDKIKNEVILKCKHKFCKECIHKWLLENDTCPICRTIINYREEYLEKRYKMRSICMCCIGNIPLILMSYYYFMYN